MCGVATRERLDRYVEALQVVSCNCHDILRTSVFWGRIAGAGSGRLAPRPSADPGSLSRSSLWRHRGSTLPTLPSPPLPHRREPSPHVAPVPRRDRPNHRWLLLEFHASSPGRPHDISSSKSEIQAVLEGQAAAWPAPVPFRNFVAQARFGVSRQEHEAFFTRPLADVEDPTAPFGLTNVLGDGSYIAEAHRDLDAQLCQRLRTQARSLGVTAAAICHLAWALVLARTSGRDDVLFGTVLFGRMHGSEDTALAMGIFINTLPIRLRVGNETVRECVRKTHELLTQLLHHEHAPLSLAQRCSSVQPPAPLFTSLMNYRYIAGGEAILVRDAVRLEETGNIDGTPSMELLAGEERKQFSIRHIHQ